MELGLVAIVALAAMYFLGSGVNSAASGGGGGSAPTPDTTNSAIQGAPVQVLGGDSPSGPLPQIAGESAGMAPGPVVTHTSILVRPTPLQAPPKTTAVPPPPRYGVPTRQAMAVSRARML